MSKSLNQVLAQLSTIQNRLQEGLPSWDSPSSEVAGFINRAKKAGRGKLKVDIQTDPGGEGPLPPRSSKIVPYGGKSHAKAPDQRRRKMRRGQEASFKTPLGARIAQLLRKKSIDPITASDRQISKRIKTAGGSISLPSTKLKTKGKPEDERRIERKSFVVQSKKGRSRAGHGGGAAGKGGASQRPYGGAYGTPSEPHQAPDDDQDNWEEHVGNYVAKTITAGGLSEGVLLERRSKAERAERKQAQKAQAAFHAQTRGADEKTQRAAGKETRKDRKTRLQRFKDKREAGALKGHKVKTKDGGKKYENSTTFKKCPQGAMVGTPYLRQEIPLNRFVKPSDDNPTYPVRDNCRASMAGVGRALQYANPGKAVVKQVLARVNRLGGIRGKARLRLWGTGVGGSRMETNRGPSGAPKRDGSYGTPTSKRDERLHTAAHEHGKAGNREVPRAHGHAAKPPTSKMSKGKKKRDASSRKVTITRGQKKLGGAGGTVNITPAPEQQGGGSTLAAQFAAKKHKKGKK